MILRIWSLIVVCFVLQSCTTTRRLKTQTDKDKGLQAHSCNIEAKERWNGKKCQVVEDKEVMSEDDCLSLGKVWESGTCQMVEPVIEPPPKAPCNMTDLKICLQYNKSKSLCYPKVGCDLKTDIPVYNCNEKILYQCINQFNGGVDACHVKYDCSPSK
jgi:hypothetical protein